MRLGAGIFGGFNFLFWDAPVRDFTGGGTPLIIGVFIGCMMVVYSIFYAN